MTTICVQIEDNVTNYNIIKDIEKTFICFSDVRMIGKGIIEFEVCCRQEDAQAIERRLASIV